LDPILDVLIAQKSMIIHIVPRGGIRSEAHTRHKTVLSTKLVGLLHEFYPLSESLDVALLPEQKMLLDLQVIFSFYHCGIPFLEPQCLHEKTDEAIAGE
jgi:hypothetical protein